MSLRRLIIGTALFSAGVLTSNTVRHGIASLRADEPLPVARVAYERDGTFVNGNKMYEDRIGEARCDWQELEPTMREQYSLSELQHNNRLLNTYLRDAPADDQRHVAYLSLVQLAKRYGSSVAAETDSMRSALGYRWDMRWGQMTNP